MPTAMAYRAWENDSIEVAKWTPQEDEREEQQSELCAEIKRAEKVLESPMDGDDESGEIFSEDTFNRATAFLRVQAAHALKMYKSFPAVPSINPGPNRSVDLHWKRKNWELLVNIPADDGRATFYGDNYGTQEFKGSFDPADFDYGVLMWLMRN